MIKINNCDQYLNTIHLITPTKCELATAMMILNQTRNVEENIIFQPSRNLWNIVMNYHTQSNVDDPRDCHPITPSGLAMASELSADEHIMSNQWCIFRSPDNILMYSIMEVLFVGMLGFDLIHTTQTQHNTRTQLTQ